MEIFPVGTIAGGVFMGVVLERGTLESTLLDTLRKNGFDVLDSRSIGNSFSIHLRQSMVGMHAMPELSTVTISLHLSSGSDRKGAELLEQLASVWKARKLVKVAFLMESEVKRRRKCRK
jgi:hypothetical protein